MTTNPASRSLIVAGLFLTLFRVIGTSGCGGGKPREPDLQRQALSVQGQAATGCSAGGGACAGSGNHASSMIGSSGGTLVLENANLQVPAGALSTPTNVTITSSAKAPPRGTLPYTPIFDFAPDGTQFSAPATVTFNIGLGAVNPVIIWSRPGGGYDELDGTYANGLITAQVTHFSSGGVVQSLCQGKPDG